MASTDTKVSFFRHPLMLAAWGTLAFPVWENTRVSLDNREKSLDDLSRPHALDADVDIYFEVPFSVEPDSRIKELLSLQDCFEPRPSFEHMRPSSLLRGLLNLVSISNSSRLLDSIITGLQSRPLMAYAEDLILKTCGDRFTPGWSTLLDNAQGVRPMRLLVELLPCRMLVRLTRERYNYRLILIAVNFDGRWEYSKLESGKFTANVGLGVSGSAVKLVDECWVSPTGGSPCPEIVHRAVQLLGGAEPDPDSNTDRWLKAVLPFSDPALARIWYQCEEYINERNANS